MFCLGQMGELVKNRFLDVLLRSQSTGGELLLQFFLSPLLGTVFSPFLERLEWRKWNGFGHLFGPELILGWPYL